MYDFFAERRQEWQAAREQWQQTFAAWSKEYPELRAEWDAAMATCLPAELEKELAALTVEKPTATRQLSGQALQIAAKHVPYLVGGSADLSPSNNSDIKAPAACRPTTTRGRYLRFGVREHGWRPAANGMALHGGLRPYVATFLVFSDYMRPSIRMSALMKQPVIYLLTHDSVYVGEDGPTHQPIEHVESLRLIPNLHVWRPVQRAGNRPGLAPRAASARTDPAALVLTRQGLPVLEGALTTAENVAKGGYVIRREKGYRAGLVLSLPAAKSDWLGRGGAAGGRRPCGAGRVGAVP